MRDNNTFRALPLDVENALAAMREERDDGQTHGMLCGEPRGVIRGFVHAGAGDAWSDFEARARLWLEDAIAKSKPPKICAVPAGESEQVIAL